MSVQEEPFRIVEAVVTIPITAYGPVGCSAEEILGDWPDDIVELTDAFQDGGAKVVAVSERIETN